MITNLHEKYANTFVQYAQ